MSQSPPSPPPPYQHCAIIHAGYDWRLYWTIDQAAGSVAFRMSAKTPTGFAALGIYETHAPEFSAQTGHSSTGSAFVDLWVLSSTSAGGGLLLDGWMSGTSSLVDPIQSFTDESVALTSTHIVGEWTRALNTSDSRDHPISLTGMTPMAYSCHPTNRAASGLGSSVWHKPDCRGTVGINFASSSCGPSELEASSFATASGDFRLEWVPAPGDPTVFDFTMTAQTTGWLSVGFSTSNVAHFNVDTIFANVDAAGTAMVQDGWLNSYGAPTADASQDVTLRAASQSATTTTIAFSRKIGTGDQSDVDLEGELTLHYAYALSQSASSMHTAAGRAQVHFLASGGRAGPSLSPPSPPAPLPAPIAPSQARSSNATAYVSADGAFRLVWELSADRTVITFTATAKTSGWVAVGFASGTVPHDAVDVYTGTVIEGVATVVDSYLNSFGQATPDATSNLLASSGREDDGETTISFTRHVTTSDALEDCSLLAEVALHWAYGPTDNLGSSHTMAARGVAIMNPMAGTLDSTVTQETGVADSIAVADPTGSGLSRADDGAWQWFSPRRDFALTWTRDEAAGTIRFIATANATGWVGVGFSLGLAPHMATDMIVGSVVGHDVAIQDSWSTRVGVPVRDTIDDVTLDAGSEVDGRTTLTFTRRIVSSDRLQDVDLSGGLVTLQWAYHQTSDSFSDAHTAAGYVNLDLHSASSASPTPMIQDAGHGLVWTVAVLFMLHAARRLTHSTCKYTSRAQRRRARELAALRKEPEPQQTMISQHMNGAKDVIEKRARQLTTLARSPKLRATTFHGSGPGGASHASDDPRWVEGGVQPGYSQAEVRKLGSVQAGDESAASPPPSPPDVEDLRHRALTLSQPKGAASPFMLLMHSLTLSKIATTRIYTFEAALFGAYVFVNLGWAFIWGSAAWHPANSLGALSAANALFIIVPASRTSLWQYLLGLPFDKMIRFHRWIGMLIVVEATGHCLWWLILFGFEDDAPNLPSCPFPASRPQSMPRSATCARGLQRVFVTQSYVYGLVAWISLALILLTSLETVRRRHYRIFQASHFAFLLFYTFAALHKPASFGPYAFGTLGLYVFDKLSRAFLGIASSAPAVSMESLPSGVLRIRMKRKWYMRPELGQYVFINLPSVSLFEWHPFTLCSSPLESDLEICVKSTGKFTMQLQKAVKSCRQPTIRIDGESRHHPAAYLVAALCDSQFLALRF